MTSILLAPHNDDETLFAAYTCLRHHPLVITCLRSFVEASWPEGPTWQQREPETQAACQILGCVNEQRTYPDDDPPWDQLGADFAQLDVERVWAPLPERGGHPHHNTIAEIALDTFGEDVVHYYATYTHAHGKTTTGTLDRPEPGWEALKRRAMDCYISQAKHPNTRVAFHEWSTDEYLSAPAAA